jgi:hypothetical protein
MFDTNNSIDCARVQVLHDIEIDKCLSIVDRTIEFDCIPLENVKRRFVLFHVYRVY